MTQASDTSKEQPRTVADSDRPLGSSRPVLSNQKGLHPRLQDVVRRHAQTRWRQPLHAPTVRVFSQIIETIQSLNTDQPLIIDAGCGNGSSTRRLSKRHPGALVLGLDQSAARLSRVGADREPRHDGDVLWARVELASFWRLALQAGLRVQHHYLLYPNPWPKSAHLARRWHGHPVFPTLIALGGVLEVRSNWAIYVREFSLACGVLGLAEPQPQSFTPAPGAALTPFEAKYHASGHELWRLQVTELLE